MDPSNLVYISAIVGFFLPHAIALLNQQHWSERVKSIIAFASCAVAAAVTSYFKGDFNVHDIAGSLFVIYTLTRASYAGLWRPTGIAPGIESATTITSPYDDVATP